MTKEEIASLEKKIERLARKQVGSEFISSVTAEPGTDSDDGPALFITLKLKKGPPSMELAKRLALLPSNLIENVPLGDRYPYVRPVFEEDEAAA